MNGLSGLTLGVIKLGFLAVLWLFVLTAVTVMRSDLFGTRVGPRGTAGAGRSSGSAGSRGATAKTTRNARNARNAKAGSRPRRGAPSMLVVTEGPLAGTTVALGSEPVTVGRSADNTIVLSDDYASGRHARFVQSEGTWFVEDLGSTNGTYVERTKVLAATPVPLGVPVRVGRTVLELRK